MLWSREKWLNPLKSAQLFAACTPAQLDRIDGLMTEVSVGPGQRFSREGGVGRDFFVIRSGEVTVTRDGVEVARLGDGDFFGEVALLDSTPRNATVLSTTRARVWVMSRPEFFEVLEQAACVEDAVQTAAEHRRRATSPA